MAARRPEDCDRLFGERLNAGDVDALLALYEPECAVVLRDGTAVSGHAAMRAYLERVVAMRVSIRLEVAKAARRHLALRARRSVRARLNAPRLCPPPGSGYARRP